MITASVSGRLGADAREIQTRTGKPMTTARIACVDDEGGTLWMELVAFGDNARWLARCCKGDRVAAIGPLRVHQWTGRDGEARETLQLMVEAMLCRAPKPRKEKRA